MNVKVVEKCLYEAMRRHILMDEAKHAEKQALTRAEKEHSSLVSSSNLLESEF